MQDRVDLIEIVIFRLIAYSGDRAIDLAAITIGIDQRLAHIACGDLQQMLELLLLIGKGILCFLLGGLTVVAGGLMLARPVFAIMSLTVLLAAYFIVSGIFEVIAGLQARPAHGWGWLLTAGIVTLLLGGMIWNQFPLSGAWAVGVLFGIRLMMSGWWLIAIGRSVRTVAGGIQP